MKIKEVELQISAVSPAQYPDQNYPEIAFVGRSNVGKSSLINTLINRKAYARTSSQPGKTQTLNFYRIDDELFLVDVPGYGYAKVSKKERAKWGQMIETYLTSRNILKGVIQLVDTRHEPSEEDVLMYNFLRHYQIPILVVATKSDKISNGKLAKQCKIIKKELDFNSKYSQFQFFSAITKKGKEEILNWINEIRF